MENYAEFKTLEEFNASLGFEPIGTNIPLKDFFKNDQCECGYAPQRKVNKQILKLMKKNRRSYGQDISQIEDSIQKEKSCPIKYALDNHINFPPVSIMSRCDQASDLYYEGETGVPKVHWALVIEINHLLKHPSGRKYGLGGFNLYGDEVHVYFEAEAGEKPTTFAWEDLVDGNTLAILYADQRKFANGDSLVVEANLDSCFVFRESLEMVKHEAHMLLLDAEHMERGEQSSCFSCAYSNDTLTLIRCANCKLAKYCSKECQSYSWKESHKRLCEQSDTLLRLAALPLIPFKDFLSFNPQEANYLPAYKQIKSTSSKRHARSLLTNDKDNDKENDKDNDKDNDKENDKENVQMLSKLLESKCGLKESSKQFAHDFASDNRNHEMENKIIRQLVN